MLELEDIIYQAISTHIGCTHLDVTGDGRHFEAIVVSQEFHDKSRVERHRLVYSALGERMREEVHALSMKLYSVEEWNKKNG